ncbi:MAG: GNAT family N-acetyltransferase [Chloroflexi bacterium]|nr:GNAT family N-acetyltransferase [Chloroflexota bacterium]
MSIRDATEADLPRLVELLDQLALDTPREERGPPLPAFYRDAFHRVDANDGQRLLVLEVDGEIVGTLVLLIIPNITHQGRPYATVENVVVEERERGAGYGRQLLTYALDQARAAGCYKLTLTSHKRRTDAHRFYERLGFDSTYEGYRVEL